jgi:hypothetical protein
MTSSNADWVFATPVDLVAEDDVGEHRPLVEHPLRRPAS